MTDDLAVQLVYFVKVNRFCSGACRSYSEACENRGLPPIESHFSGQMTLHVAH